MPKIDTTEYGMHVYCSRALSSLLLSLLMRRHNHSYPVQMKQLYQQNNAKNI